MEVRDPIHGNIEIEPTERGAIEDPFFQRLRNIKQMGFADLAFPGATHNRYAHSLGAMKLAGDAFDSVFKGVTGPVEESLPVFRHLVRLAALLHDIGHAPFSHVCEFAMPPLRELAIPAMAGAKPRRATHEDYTVKIITDSSMAQTLREAGEGAFTPLHVAALVNPGIKVEDGRFEVGGVDYRPVLSQLISSELDADRMDYLQRDSLNSGVGYGHFDLDWILTNLTFHVTEDKRAHLALDPRAIYAFDDFMIARYHMFLMVYYHHKSVIYEELLHRHFEACPGSYHIPSDIAEYALVDDYHLFSYLRGQSCDWAQRIVQRDPYQLLLESHALGLEPTLDGEVACLMKGGVPIIESSSRGGLSKYSQPGTKRRLGPSIFVKPKFPKGSPFQRTGVGPLEEFTDIFKRYESERQIRRVYVPREEKDRARRLIGLD